ncbi:MAG: sugar phosphate isomerase/epimerase family protein [Planctomycetota bacterium]
MAAVAGTAIAGGSVLKRAGAAAIPETGWFRISLAQWSLHKLLFEGRMDHLDFAAEARGMGFEAIEYVNAFFKDKARDIAYLDEMNKRASDEGIEQLLIMCDGEGDLGDPDASRRSVAVSNHKKWLEAAKQLGCHSIRVNAASSGTSDEQQKLASDGLRSLCELAEPYSIHVLVENHGGLSSNGAWLAGVMQRVDHRLVGTLPDFGNFCMDWSRAETAEAWYDRYKGVRELMPYAKAVSAKSHEFNDKGEEVRTDFGRMLGIVEQAGYRGWIGVEYEGDILDPRAGSIATRKLLERVRDAG